MFELIIAVALSSDIQEIKQASFLRRERNCVRGNCTPRERKDRRGLFSRRRLFNRRGSNTSTTIQRRSLFDGPPAPVSSVRPAPSTFRNIAPPVPQSPPGFKFAE